MDLYVFVQEAGTDGVEELAEVDTVRAVIRTAGEYAAYAALADDDPARVYDALARIRDIEDLIGVDAYVALEVDTGPRPLPRPLPMPTRVVAQTYVCFSFVTTEPGATTEVYTAIAAGGLASAAAIVAGHAPLVLVELTADDREQLASALDLLGSVPRVRDLSSSIGLGG